MNTETYYFIGIDGGASTTHGVLFADDGKTIADFKEAGTNLIEYPKTFPDRILNVVHSLCSKGDISIDMVDSIGLGIAGTSDEYGRELLFKTMNDIGLARRTLVISDAEASFVTSCQIFPAFLITIGTGFICLGRSEDGGTYRTGGKGHSDDGDIGSGFWLGKKMIMHLALNETVMIEDQDLFPLLKLLLDKTETDVFSESVQKIANSDDRISITASFAKDICQLAEEGNDVALSFLQEGTQAISEEIINLTKKMNYSKETILFAGNGNLIRNDFFRKCLNDALQFDFKDITWTFSTISSAYGAGMLAAKLVDMEVSLKTILKGDPIASV